MKLYGVDIPRTNRKQKNQFDGKLYLVDRHFLCQRRFSGIDPRVAQHVLMPAGTFLLCGPGRSLLTSGLYRTNKSRPIRLGAVFCPCSLRNQRTNGINTSRMTETHVCMVTATTTGAREDIVQKSNKSGGASKRHLVKYWTLGVKRIAMQKPLTMSTNGNAN